MKDLGGRIAFVTGGSSGIGLGLVKVLAAEGMKVAFTYRQVQHRDEALEYFRQHPGQRVHAIQLDVTDRAGFAVAADEAERVLGGPVQLLINNAGVGVHGLMEHATYADWDWVMGVNLGGTINGIVTILPRIQKHGEGGHIVSTASMSGLLPHPGATIYGTSKGAIVSMMECMRAELEPQGIICSAFCPGAVQSNIAEAAKTRPADLAKTGYGESDKRRSLGRQFFHLYQTKEEVGERVLRGILNDELYIMTHSEFRQGLEDRVEAIREAVPELPENEEYKRTFSVLFRNPIHAAEVARQKGLKS
jgi:NAD(P)-dependent dehydrogenase (short-subunit alcohol dehydrogenase family)